MLVTGTFVDEHAAFKQRTVQTGVALCRGHDTNGTVTVFVVIPMGQIGHPATCSQQVFERLDRQLGRYFSVLNVASMKGLSLLMAGRLRVLATPRRCIAAMHCFSFHRHSVVRVHCQLARRDAVARADVTQQLSCEFAALAIEHLPADDLAAEQVFEQVQIKVLATHLSGQVCDVPAEDLIGSGRCQGAWLAALLRRTLQASVGALAVLSSNRYKVDSDAR